MQPDRRNASAAAAKSKDGLKCIFGRSFPVRESAPAVARRSRPRQAGSRIRAALHPKGDDAIETPPGAPHPWRRPAVIRIRIETMAAKHELKATARPEVGKGAARTARRAGKVPGVIYGDKKPPVTISLDAVERNRNGRFLVAIDHARHLAGAARGTGGPLADLGTRGSLQLVLRSHSLDPYPNYRGPPPGVRGAGRRFYSVITFRMQRGTDARTRLSRPRSPCHCWRAFSYGKRSPKDAF